MYLTIKDVQNLNEERLKSFLASRKSEGLHIDYKEALPSNKEKAYKEFLKDVTAFANAQGGHILIGAKEPKDGLAVEDQIVGLDGGDSIAQDLERVCSDSIDPRIPGLLTIPVRLSNGRFVIVIHIPPSLGRPHMVNYKGLRTFYIRHWESSVHMTSHEIRESVITALSAEALAKDYMERMEEDARKYLIVRPTILLQAMPLISLESPWPVLEDGVVKIIRGESRRRNQYGLFNLESEIAPTPIIEGIMGRDDRQNPTWRTEVHRNGYALVLFFIKFGQKYGYDIEKPFLSKGHCQLFRAFFEFLSELWELTGTDLPYIFNCKYLEARDTVLYSESLFSKFTEPYIKAELIWPCHYRQIWEDPMKIADLMCREMFNAFGLKDPS